MESPIYARTVDGIRDEVFSRFYRISTAETGDILAEFGAAHIVAAPDAHRFPPGSVLLDRYSNLRPSRNAPTPLLLRATPENAALIAAVRAMRPADVSHMQRHDNGCGAAVVAWLTGASYADAVRDLYPSGAVRVLGTQRLAAATRTKRRECESGSWDEAARAGAVAALIRAPAARVGHYVVIKPGMAIVDPELVLPWRLAEYPRRAWSPLMYFVRA